MTTGDDDGHRQATEEDSRCPAGGTCALPGTCPTLVFPCCARLAVYAKPLTIQVARAGLIVTTLGGSVGGAARPKLLDEGIKVGEITAYRAWRVISHHLLGSVGVPRIWYPGEVMEGKPSIDTAEGVYSAMSMDDIRREFPLDLGYCYGTVKIWGDIIVHERGYRSQYARIVSLDSVGYEFFGFTVCDIAKHYGVPLARPNWLTRLMMKTYGGFQFAFSLFLLTVLFSFTLENPPWWSLPILLLAIGATSFLVMETGGRFFRCILKI